VGGFVDPTDYVDVYALASPWTGFMNFAFSTGSASIAVPNEGFGLAASGMLTDNIFLIGGLADLNSDPTDPGQTVESFFQDNEYFKHIEIGWTPSQDRIYLDNVHLTYWHADERVEALTPSGWGLNFSWTRYLGGKWLPFLRGGYAQDGGSLLQKSVSAGFGYQPNPGQNLLGVGLNWGQPNEDTWGSGLPDQYTAEVFYRWQISKAFAMTPDIQYLKDPAQNQETDSLWVFGLRVRGAF
jgi:porin